MTVVVTTALAVGGPGVSVLVAGGVTSKSRICPGRMIEFTPRLFQAIKFSKEILYNPITILKCR